MEFKTKFSVRETVFVIIKGSQTKEEPCPTCKGKGRISVENESFSCPKCYGNRIVYKNIPNKWHLFCEQGMTVGQVRVEYTESDGFAGSMFENYSAQSSYKEQYMLLETGVGSGSIWNGEDLFASKKDALAECKKRNEEDEKE